jgi:hypothetical protein
MQTVLICIALTKRLKINEIEHKEHMMGWGLFFTDLIRATSLNDKLKVTAFNYEVTEALHLSDKEKIFD